MKFNRHITLFSHLSSVFQPVCPHGGLSSLFSSPGSLRDSDVLSRGSPLFWNSSLAFFVFGDVDLFQESRSVVW